MSQSPSLKPSLPDASVAGHFGEWLQGRLTDDGPVVLITMPCPVLKVTARRITAAGALQVTAAQGPAPVSAEQAHRVLTHLRLPTRGHFEITHRAPPGGGSGVSTASLMAIAKAAQGTADRHGPAALARACLLAEGASDPLMLREPERHLWASRNGLSLRRFAPLPVVEIVGGFLGPTLHTNPDDTAFPLIGPLVEAFARAVASSDRAGVARVASRSSDLCDELRGPVGSPMPALARRFGALGYCRAHTGSARGLIFEPGTASTETEQALCDGGFTGIVRFLTPARG